MTPDEFLRSIEKRDPQPAYLFLGPEAWARDRCRKALIDKVLPPEEREQGLTRHDLSEVEFGAVMDDARSLLAVFQPACYLGRVERKRHCRSATRRTAVRMA